MAETIISIRCTKCNRTLPQSCYFKDRSRPDGLDSWCKACKKAYAQSKSGKAAHLKAMQKYREHGTGKEADRRYEQSVKGKHSRCRQGAKHRLKYPEKHKARTAVGNAIKAGALPHPTTLNCVCGHFAREYHHHLGYAPEHRLDVIPMCIQCHHDLHLSATGDSRATSQRGA